MTKIVTGRRQCSSLAMVAAMLLSAAGAAPARSDELSDLNRRVGILYDAGKHAEAVETAKRAVALAEKTYGPDHQAVAVTLNSLAALYKTLGRLAEAEPLAKRSLIIREKTLGPDHPDVDLSLDTLADVYFDQLRLAEAEPLLRRSLAIREKTRGADDPSVGACLNTLAELYRIQGRYSAAEPLYKRAIGIYQKSFGKEHSEVGTIQNNLATVYERQGRFGEAELLYKRVLAIKEKALGVNSPHVGSLLNNLASVYWRQGRLSDAEPLFKRALANFERALGAEDRLVASGLNNLALLYETQGRYAEAEPLHRRALAITQKVLEPNHPFVATSLDNLAQLLRIMGRPEEALPLHEQSLAIREKVLVGTHPDLAVSLNNLALLRRDLGQTAEAATFARRALEKLEAGLSPDHPSVATALGNLATIALAQSDWPEAVERWRRSRDIIAQRTLRDAGESGASGGGPSQAEQQEWLFLGLVKAAYRLGAESSTLSQSLAREMFETAQWPRTSKAAASLAQMAARGAVGDTALADLVRERQDLVGEWQAKDKLRIAAVSQPLEKRNATAEKEVTGRLAAIDKRLAEIDARLIRDFPDFAALTSPAPVSVADIQVSLEPDEALVMLLDTDDRFKPLPGETFIWAVTKDKVQWAKSDIGTADLAKKVAAFRKPLDLLAQAPRALAKLEAHSAVCAPEDTRGLARADACTESTELNLALAHELYAKLLGAVAETIEEKQHLILVPSGPLTGLPFNALLTEPPPAGKSTLATMKAAPWLVRKHAITILPSASSLKALRRSAKASGAAKPFVGFGNPDFRGKAPGGRPSGRGPEDKLGEGESPGSRKAGETRVATRAVSDYFRGALADVEALRAALPSLPDTADELKAIGQTLAASDTDIVLGPKASEATVKAMSDAGALAAYKVVAFATHGLVAGQLKGLAEPAIALSVPKAASESDDGLLTASEAAALKLDADWVILSACNTAAGGEPGAEALSGLSRAFFYAGTRALLVSHWEVESSAAVRLTTGTFAALKANPSLGRAGAFRQSMLDLIDDGAPHEAHPAYWAPFFVVGEGAAR